MKCKVLFLALVFFSNFVWTQNLVPNPSFEDYVDCPFSVTELHENCVDWYSFAVTPDYFNACSINAADVPANAWGYQWPITGEAYAALFTYTHSFADMREYIAAPLTSTLAIGQSYYVMFYVSLYDGGGIDFLRCATDRIGAKFFIDPNFSESNPYLPENNSDIQYDQFVTDTAGWVLIDGWFKADDEYDWVVLGNFYDDSLTDTIQLGDPGFCAGAYYVENVCIASDPADCDYLKQESDITSNVNLDQEETIIQIFPNPSVGWFQLKATTILTEVKIYNTIGQIINYQYSGQQALDIDGTNWSKGLYILKVKDENNHQHIFKITKQ